MLSANFKTKHVIKCSTKLEIKLYAKLVTKISDKILTKCVNKLFAELSFINFTKFKPNFFVKYDTKCKYK